MDSESRAVAEFLDHLATVNTRFAEFAIQMRARQDVVGASHLLECRKYDYNVYPVIQGFVEVRFRETRAISCTLDVARTDEEWQISSSIVTSSNGGERVLKEFPDRLARSFREFLRQLDSAISDMMTISAYIDDAGQQP